MTTVRTTRAGAAVRALTALGAAALVALAWPAPSPSAAPASPVDLGPYVLADGLFDFTAPPVPQNVRAEGHDRSIEVSWEPSVASDLKDYRVYLNGSPVGTVAQPRTTVRITGLTNIQNYSVQVTARDGNPNESARSAPATATPFDDVPPSAVTGLVAARGDGQVTLTWEPESATESDRAGVRVYVDGSLRTSLPAATTRYEVTGLSNDVEHTFYLVAFDARPTGFGPPGSVAPNASQPSATVRATPTDLTPPSTPTAFTAVRGDASAALSWTAPPESDVGLYKVVDETGALIASFTAPATSGTATALTNGRAQRLRLVAVDTHGNHSPATAEVTVTPATPPVARTGLTAVRGDTTVRLTWEAPVADARAAVATGVRVLVDGALRTTVAGTATSYTVTGLTNDVAYAFSLVAVDAEGRTSAETARARATPTDLTAPSAPTALAARRGDATAALTWTAPPEGDVGTYLVLGQDGSTLTTVTAPATAHQLTGLANGTTYRLRLVAVDTSGNRSTPTGVVVVTPLAPPLAITGLTAAAQGSKVDLAWDAPASAFGHEDAVQVQVWRVGSPDQLLTTVPASQRSYRWTGYSPGSSESFHVVAVDADPRAAERSNVVSTVLAAPQDVTATVEDRATRITWSSVLGATGYRVERSGGGGPVVVGPVADTSLDVSGMTNGTAYTFRVLALDSGRVSAPSTDVGVTPLALPAVVAGLRAERQGADVLLTWAAPAAPPSDTAATTRVQVYRAGSPDVLLDTVGSPAATFTAPDQPTDPRPQFYVVALDVHERPSAASALVATALAVPQGVAATSGPRSARVTWTAVPGAERYLVQRLVGQDWVEEAVVATASLDVSGLTDGQSYTFRVIATAPTAGTTSSAPSVSVTITAGYTPPTTVPAGGSGGGTGVSASRDGRFAVLALPGASGRLDLVRVDRLGEGRTVLATGVPTQQPGLARTAISEDGRYVALITADPHDARDVNGKADVYRYDTAQDTWAWVSGPYQGTSSTSDTFAVPGLNDGASTDPSKGPQVAITGDGSRVFFLSARKNLVRGDTDDSLDLFSTALTPGSTTGTTTRITTGTAASDRPSGTGFAVTPSGSHVLYTAGSGSFRSLVRQDATAGGAKVLVTGPSASALVPLDGVGQTAISDDGRRVLAVRVDGPNPTVVQADLTSPTAPPAGAPAGTPSRVQATGVVASDYGAGQVALSPDGVFAFVATKEALLPADTNGHVDVYRVALASPSDPSSRVLVTAGPDGLSTTLSPETGPTLDEVGAITARDADHVVVVTQRPLIAADGNRVRDAYAADLSLAPADRSHPLVGAS